MTFRRRLGVAGFAGLAVAAGIGGGIAAAHRNDPPWQIHLGPTPSAPATDSSNAPDVPGQPDIPEPGDRPDEPNEAADAPDVPGQPDLPEPGDVPDAPGQ
jgi:hypothetical protein